MIRAWSLAFSVLSGGPALHPEAVKTDAALVADLGSRSFHRRDAATYELARRVRADPSLGPAFRERLPGLPDGDARGRLRSILAARTESVMNGMGRMPELSWLWFDPVGARWLCAADLPPPHQRLVYAALEPYCMSGGTEADTERLCRKLVDAGLDGLARFLVDEANARIYHQGLVTAGVTDNPFVFWEKAPWLNLLP